MAINLVEFGASSRGYCGPVGFTTTFSVSLNSGSLVYNNLFRICKLRLLRGRVCEGFEHGCALTFSKDEYLLIYIYI